jgi:hypothetical protein
MIPCVKGVAVALLALGLCASGALAATGEPQHEFTKAGQARAVRASLQQSDLPPGWVGQPKDKQSANDADPRCSYYNPDQSDLTENGNAASPQFTLANGSFVSSSTSIFKTAAQGRTAYARVVQPKLPKCLAELFRKGATPAKATILSALERSFPKLAERSNAYRIAAGVKTPAGSIPVYLDVVVMNRAKVDVVVFFAGIVQAFSDSFERSVASKVAARTASA